MKALLVLSFLVVGALAANDAAVRLFATTAAANPNAGGYITFAQVASGDMNVTVDIWGLAPNTEHGYHIHVTGDTTSADGSAAGLHFDPLGTSNHACPGNNARHEGDMGNFTTDANGNFHGSFVRDLLQATMVGDTTGGDPSIIGHSVIVHTASDDCRTQPTGNSGTRYLQGTIGIAENAASTVGQSYQPSMVVAALYNNSGNRVGVVYLVDNGGGIDLQLKAGGFIPGSVHGIHIHQWGDHARLDGLSVGGHLNPLSQPHALPDENTPQANRHVGDLGNAVASADGFIYLQQSYTLVALGGTTASNAIGHALVIHSKNDEGMQMQPTGNSGSRLALGILGVSPDSPPTADTIPYAVVYARIYGTANMPNVTGSVKMSYDDSQTLNVECNILHLPPSTKLAMHVHEFGDESDSLGLATGGHFNPHGALHGCPPNGTRHAGDIGTFTTDAQGQFQDTIRINALMAFAGQNSTVGRAIIIHAQLDNCGQPTGNAGSRIGQGVLGIFNPPAPTLIQTAVNPANYPVSPWSVLRAVLHPTTNSATSKLSGWAWFRTSPYDATKTQVYINVTGVQPVSQCHGVHVHQYGDMSAADGTSEGGHWNPAGVAHALPINTTRHQGDLGNVCVDADGNGVLVGDFDVITISNIVGRGLVLHQAEDLGYAYQPTGNTVTTRIGFGVIGIAGPTATQPPWLAPISSSSTGSDCIGDQCSPAAAVHVSMLAVLVAALLAIVLRF